MKSEKLQDALGMIGEDLYDEDNLKPKKRKYRRIKRTAIIAALLCVSVICGIALRPMKEQGLQRGSANHNSIIHIAPIDEESTILGNDPSDIYLYNGILATAVYPVSPIYPYTEETASDNESWYSFYEEMDAELESLDIDLDSFYTKTCKVFFNDTENKNRLYSPVNLYMALAMLAEISAGESRSQLLALTDCESIEELRINAKAIWKACYKNDGVSSLILANSLWLDENYDYNPLTIDSLAEFYYASSFSGECGSEEFNEALREWINTETHGVLEDSVNDIEISSETILTLASTIYFYAKWSEEFDREQTEIGIFHSYDGDTELDFMHSSAPNNYFRGEGFSAVKKQLSENGTMYFILPDEECSPESLFSGDEVYRFIEQGDLWQNQEYMTVNMSVPKFDISSKEDMKEGLIDLGITDVFDAEKANFGNLTDARGYASCVEHSVRVNIDEEGCEAAAYTTIGVDGTGRPPEKEIDFILERPFIFVITSDAGIPLYTGIVNQP